MESEQPEQVVEAEAPEREFPLWKAMRRKFSANNSFFFAGNLERELVAKQASLDITEEEKTIISRLEEEQSIQNMFCPIAGCGAKIKSLADFETHHVQRHMSMCSACCRVFPTTRLLNLHVAETHDSFFQAKAARGFAMYECYVEGCPRIFQSGARRLQHLVDAHQFPRSFSIRSKKHLSQGQRKQHKRNAYKQVPEQPSISHGKPLSSKFHPKKSQQGAMLQIADDMQEDQGRGPVDIEKDGPHDDVDMDILTAGVSRLSTVSQATDDMPILVSFGRRRTRGSTRCP